MRKRRKNKLENIAPNLIPRRYFANANKENDRIGLHSYELKDSSMELQTQAEDPNHQTVFTKNVTDLLKKLLK